MQYNVTKCTGGAYTYKDAIRVLPSMHLRIMIWPPCHVVPSAGIYFGKPKGFGTDENGNRTGFNTMIYSTPEVRLIPFVRYSLLHSHGTVYSTPEVQSHSAP